MRQLLLKLPRNSQSFLIQSQIAEHQYISYISFIENVKMLFDIHWKGNANLIGPRKGYFC